MNFTLMSSNIPSGSACDFYATELIQYAPQSCSNYGAFNCNFVTLQIYHKIPTGYLSITTDVRQPWTNYVNNGNKHLIVGADVRSEYSNIRYLHLIIGKAQKFVSGDKYDF